MGSLKPGLEGFRGGNSVPSSPGGDVVRGGGDGWTKVGGAGEGDDG